ncbi:MAG: sulfatase-like hydrolase/transferase [Lewinellaceae bacterium]|nr:sulfatase-like hydrolase/transferase [Lewinellaceae bacterium]
MMSIKHFLICLLLGLGTTTNAQTRPNFIIFFVDDLGYGDLGCFGNPVIRTPNLDKMAAEGLKMTSFYACSPACTASRYALLTGKYPARSGFSWVLGPTSSKGMHPKEVTLAEALQDAGYATAMYGKWHLGTRKKAFMPLQNGFDDYYGLPYSNDMIPPKWGDIALVQGNDTLELNPDQSLLTEAYTQHALAFIEKNKSQPFFLYLPYTMVHVPLHPGKAFEGKSRRGLYGDAMEEIDASVGRIRAQLEAAGLSQNTLLVFCSDNGPWLTQGINAGSAGLLRDGKGSTWEGGLRVPGIACWPGTIQAGQQWSETASTIDLYRTFCSLGQARFGDHQPDGQDLSNFILGEGPAPEYSQRTFFYYGPGNRLQAVRKGFWKLHIITNSQLQRQYFDKSPPLLFNLDQDPGEWYELSDAFPEVVNDLLAEISRHQQALGNSPGYWDQERNAARIYHKAFGKTVRFVTPPHENYPNPIALTDGWLESPEEFNHLAGFRGDSMCCILDLDSIQSVQKVQIGFLQETQSWIFLPSKVGLEYSTDGHHWTALASKQPDFPQTERSVRQGFQWTFTAPIQARFFRFSAHSIGACPAWHQGAGQASWMFPDEIIVE